MLSCAWRACSLPERHNQPPAEDNLQLPGKTTLPSPAAPSPQTRGSISRFSALLGKNRKRQKSQKAKLTKAARTCEQLPPPTQVLMMGHLFHSSRLPLRLLRRRRRPTRWTATATTASGWTTWRRPSGRTRARRATREVRCEGVTDY